MHFNTFFVFLNFKCMKNYELYVGIDISKLKLDVSFVIDPSKKEHDHLIVDNNSKGLGLLVKAIQKRHSRMDEVFVCFENTGVYGMPLAMFLSKQKIDYSMVAALEIKRSKGISRGKNDKADARDIALYAVTHKHKLSLYELPEEDILKLQLLHNQREKLMKATLALSMSDENNGFLPKEVTKEIQVLNRSVVKKLKEALAEVEERMMEIIKANEQMKKQYGLVTSVPGVGQQVAIALILATKSFTAFDEWRQLACYVGIAPFEYSSGSSIRGKAKVSQMANKKLKGLLTMSALAAKRSDKQIADYYKKKTGEGKNAMSVLNAIRCKVVARVFATIQRGTPYVDTQKFAA